MNFVKLACLSPHPPIIIPEVGGREVEKTKDTVIALKQLSAEIEEISPDTIVIISPHTPIYADAFTVKAKRKFFGSLASFGVPEVNMSCENDIELASEIIEAGRSSGLPIFSSKLDELDHGILVPLYYLGREECKLVSLSISMLPYETHYQLGTLIRDAIEKLERNVVFIASGDLSHRLLPGAPAGFSPRGSEFDRRIAEIISSGKFEELFALDEGLIEEAGECGLRSIFTMAGLFKGRKYKSQLLSYEGPFGVGYMVAKVTPL